MVLYGKHAKNVMKTDVKETDNSYEVDIDLPGFKKDEIEAKLEKVINFFLRRLKIVRMLIHKKHDLKVKLNSCKTKKKQYMVSFLRVVRHIRTLLQDFRGYLIHKITLICR